MSFRQSNDAIARRPALPVAVLFISGIAAHRALPPNPVAWIVTTAILLLGASLLIRRASCSLVIGAAVGLSGACAGQLSESYFPPNEIGAFASDTPRLAWVEGTIRDEPRTTEPSVDRPHVPDKQIIELEVRAVNTRAGWLPATGRMPLTISPPVPGIAAGQLVRALGRIERPLPVMNPGGFDAADHYRRQRVLVSMHVSKPYDVQILSRPNGPLALLARLRERSRDLLDAGFGPSRPTDRALLRALVFGDREPALNGVAQDFARTGTTHLLASNGARVALVAGAIYLLCRLFRFRPRRQVLLATLCVAAFGMLTLPAAETIRPAIVCAAVGFGLFGRRTLDALQVLSIAALAILVLRPMDLYGAGFQMSFTIVCGMIVFTGPMMRWIDRFENKDRRVAESFQTPTRWRRYRRWAERKLIQTVVVGVVAWLVAMPLVVFHFEQFNPWTVPLGAILSPFALAALLAGFVKIFLTAICPVLAASWASAAAPVAGLLRHVVHEMARVPGSDIPVSTPPAWELFVYYALLFVPLLPWPRPKLRWCARCAPVGGCALVLLLPLCGGLSPIRSGGRALRITLLSVGAGQCAVVEPSGGGTVIFDAGSSTLSDPARMVIEPFLRHEQCRGIDAIWLSHGDFDHIGAVCQLCGDYRVGEVVTSPHFRRHAHESKPCESLLKTLDSTSRSPRLVVLGDRRLLKPDVAVEVLWPPGDCAFNSNNTGLVLRMTCCGRSILFPADIQEPAERELLKHPERLKSDVLIAPHHGSAEPTTARFVAAVNPAIILASNDARLTQKQRAFDALESARPIYRTSAGGAIVIEVFADGSLRVRPFVAGPALPYRTIAN